MEFDGCWGLICVGGKVSNIGDGSYEDGPNTYRMRLCVSLAASLISGSSTLRVWVGGEAWDE